MKKIRPSLKRVSLNFLLWDVILAVIIFLVLFVQGDGVIQANGGPVYMDGVGGAGGRVAVVLTKKGATDCMKQIVEFMRNR